MKNIKLILAAVVALAAPAYADSGNGNGTGGPDVYGVSGVLHSYSAANPIDKEVGLCGLAPHFPKPWRPCWDN